MTYRAKFFASPVAIGAVLLVSSGHAEVLPRTTFGTTGLIEMPSAEMAPDGQMSATLAFFQDTQRYNLDFQALPWLEASFRYASVAVPDARTYYDRSYGLKLRLLQEGEYLPALVIGAQDLKGTGIYAGEYIAASRHVFNDFDVTLGLGWGRMATSAVIANPLAQVFASFKDRKALDGEVDAAQMFHGRDIGVFGGVVWQTPIENLALSAEYSSDRYVQETARGGFKPASQVNVGVSYRPFDFMQVGVDWLYGRSVAATVTFALDPTTNVFAHDAAPRKPAVALRSEDQRHDALVALLDRDAGPASFMAAAVKRPRTAADTRSIGVFVDRAMTDGVQSVTLKGAKVFVIVDAAKFSVGDCRALAGLVSGLQSRLDTVTLAAAHRRYPITCAVPKGEAVLSTARYTGPEIEPDLAAYEAQNIEVAAADADALPAWDTGSIEDRIRRDGAEQSLRIEAVKLGAGNVEVYYANAHYRSEADAVGRLTRILMADVPSSVEYFKLVALYEGIPLQQFEVSRSAVERLFAQGGSLAETPGAVSVSRPSPDEPALAEQRWASYPRFNWAVVPTLRENYFGSDTPTEGSFSLGVAGQFEVSPGLSLNAEADANVWNDFTVPATNRSTLAHVRSDYPLYLDRGAQGIGQLYGAYHFGLAPGIVAVAKAGYLESMFAGVGGEVLWQPEASRFAVGVDAYEVWQRNFDRLFGFQDYRTFTGHVAVYYRSPWWGLNAKLMAGQYLAGDHGATLEITRRFETGVEIGAFATVTDVSHERFGQGSFDKGIVIRIPLEWALPVSTQSAFDLSLKPMLRDGGQRLEGDTTLYGETQRMSLGQFDADQGKLTSP